MFLSGDYSCATDYIEWLPARKVLKGFLEGMGLDKVSYFFIFFAGLLRPREVFPLKFDHKLLA